MEIGSIIGVLAIGGSAVIGIIKYYKKAKYYYEISKFLMDKAYEIADQIEQDEVAEAFKALADALEDDELSEEETKKIIKEWKDVIEKWG